MCNQVLTGAVAAILVAEQLLDDIRPSTLEYNCPLKKQKPGVGIQYASVKIGYFNWNQP